MGSEGVSAGEMPQRENIERELQDFKLLLSAVHAGLKRPMDASNSVMMSLLQPEAN